MFYVASFLLSPIIAWQSIYLRRTTIKLPEASGVREGTIGEGDSLNILYLGDSAAAGVGVDHLDNALVGKLNRKLAKKYTVNWQLIAQNGDRTHDAISRLENLYTNEVDIAIISLGVNEVTCGCPINVWRQTMHSLIELLRHKYHCSHILITCVPPMASFPALRWPLNWLLGWRANQLNHALAKYSRDRSYIHLLTPDLDDHINGFAIDGFHPNELGYEKWAEAAQDAVERIYTNPL
ncbi:SGNH/GDSL hydrolase family protein [Thalassotalea fusca]